MSLKEGTFVNYIKSNVHSETFLIFSFGGVEQLNKNATESKINSFTNGLDNT